MSKIRYRSPWFNLDGYHACSIKYIDGSRRTILQHREVMEEYLGRALRPSEIVHHRDGNRTNNAIENLELMDRATHSRHHGETRKPTPFTGICLLCQQPFERQAKEVRANKKRGKAGPFCGKRCAGLYGQRIQMHRRFMK